MHRSIATVLILAMSITGGLPALLSLSPVSVSERVSVRIARIYWRRLAWWTDWFAADKLPFPKVACYIVPVHVGHILAMEKCTVFTVAISVIWVVRLLVASSYSPSGEVPGAAVGPSPVPLLSLIWCSDPNCRGCVLLQHSRVTKFEQGGFLTVPLNFQNQNEKQVAANQH